MATMMKAAPFTSGSKPVAGLASKPLASRAVSRKFTVVARAGKAKAASTAYVCLDCGWIYDGAEPFEKLPSNFKCPVCRSPKRRFKATEASSRKNDAKSMSSRMARMEDDGKLDESDKSIFVIAGVAGAAILGGLYFFLNSQVQ